MRYLGMATDYDGTLAARGRVPEPTLEALARLRASGRRAILVTGRELGDLQRICDRLELFDLVIAENGGVLHTPSTGATTALAPAPAPAFVDALRARGVPIGVGAVIVATDAEHYTPLCVVIRELSLEVDVIRNKGSVMVLPAGVNKGTGVARAAVELSLPLRSLVGVGDAENDHTLLRACGLGVAVANALESLKEQADLVTHGEAGEGVAQLIDRMILDDLAGVSPRPRSTIGVVPHEREALAPRKTPS
jgi:hydroxymethylpyrimidine pyrophosphatase-like HAD family hydrolase